MDRFDRRTRSRIMASVRSRRTAPEMRLHGILKGARVRHRMWPDLPGRPDALVPGGSRPTAVFVDGCFWHGCPRHHRTPKTNAAFWRRKIAANARRRRSVARRLRGMGYSISTIWEHDLR